MEERRQAAITRRKRFVRKLHNALAGLRWERYLKKLRDWRRKCNCFAILEDSRGGEPSLAMLTDMIRRLAGTAGGAANKDGRHEFSDALKGRAGSRGCGPSCWDNAVRALEEDC